MENPMMAGPTVLDPDLIQAYLDTDYRVEGDMPMVLKVGVRTPALTCLMASHHALSCAFMTACNPRSQLLDPAANSERQAVLARELTAQGFRFISGVGAHPHGDWPPEPSYLVFGLSLETAKAIAMRHAQNALVWCEADTLPRLVLLR
jgi:hypothetical protein